MFEYRSLNGPILPMTKQTKTKQQLINFFTMKKLFVSLLAIAGLVACTNDEVVNVQSNNAIAFDTFVENSTRANDPSFTRTTLDKFDVWAFVENERGTVLGGLDANDVNGGENVTRVGDNLWSYANLQYWTPDHTYYFAAVAPMDSDNWRYDLNTYDDEYDQGQDNYITFTNIDGTEDLIYAFTKVETPETISSMDAVKFQFNHLLSKVGFTFKNEFTTGNVYFEVVNVQMDVPAKATYYVDGEGAWDIDENITTPTTLEFGSVAKMAKQEAKSAANELFTIPAAADNSYTVKFTIKHYNGGVLVNTYGKESTITGVEFEKGKAYNFVAGISPENLNLKAIEFTVDTVNGWEETAPIQPVSTPEELVTIAQAINEGTIDADANIELTNDIDLSKLSDLFQTRAAATSNWIPVGTKEKPYTGTFDGNGFTIKNLSLVETEAKEGKAYIGFFGYAKDATIKNVTFENVYINIPCLDIDHSQGHIGAVAGSLEGTSTIENVTVKGDITVYATQDANGASRVAVVAGGNSYGNVTMKNVHVVANEGSSLIANNNTGALAGQLQGKMVFENCSSNIDVTVNKFFAGGLVGIAAGDSYIKNCHTTGDVSVVAGREGRHNDEYRVGGIAGGWADGKTKVFTLEGCTYSGEVSGKNSDGTVANPLDYAGYVGRGYTLANCAGSKVVIDGVEYVQIYDDVYGVYTVNGKYVVAAPSQLEKLATLVNGGKTFEGITVVLANDIDLKGEEWTPIGSAYTDHGFMGNFDGNGKTIKNLSIKNITPDSDGYVYAGLFGVTEGTDADNQNYIKNLTIENVDIDLDGHIVAAAIAYPYYTKIENVTVKGNVSIKGGNYTSGVLAYTRRCVDAKNISIIGNEDSVIEGDITVGGVISDIQTNGGLTANYSNFSATGLTIKGTKCVGGISGIICNQTLDGATVKNVTIDCKDDRTGIVAGAEGGKSTIENVVYENVTGATRVIGATYDGGLIFVSTADELIEALEAGKGVFLANDIKIDPAKMSNAYGKTGINVKNGQTIDGGGHTLNIQGAGGTWDSGINTTGGVIKNITVTGSFRGIFINHNSDHSEKVVLKNVTTTGTVYTISCDQGKYQGIEATDCAFYGWTSFAKTAGEAKFTNCYFGEGSGYKFCRPYSKTEFVNCTFCPGYTVDESQAEVTFTNCTFEE